MHVCLKLKEVLSHLQEDIRGIREISVLEKDGTLLCRFPEKKNGDSVPDMLELIQNGSCCSRIGEVNGVVLKGKNHFLAHYAVPETEIFLSIYGDSSINLGLMNSGARSTCSRIQEIMYIPSD
ncbi:MAG: hypothetical protein V2I97_12580 [Desulfococcaceae bacterium]|jgi:predicted regulator of Ras-like GTPase activity (Roadblock/LC7/MglB family)|nr:hypothetical protein [Desulfococcaceae bacterium]